MNVYDELKKRGAAKAVVHFSGGGDDGGVEQISLLNSEGKEIGTLQEYVYGGDDKQTPADTELAEALSKPVYDKYYSFAGEFYVSGTVVWDAETRKHKMSGQESVETYEEFEDEESDEVELHDTDE